MRRKSNTKGLLTNLHSVFNAKLALERYRWSYKRDGKEKNKREDK